MYICIAKYCDSLVLRAAIKDTRKLTPMWFALSSTLGPLLGRCWALVGRS